MSPVRERWVQARILRLNLAGQPVAWLSWQEAVCLYSRDLVVWSMGEVAYSLRGGYCRMTGKRTRLQLPSIIACGGDKLVQQRINPTLTNRTLFMRDEMLCMYCGGMFEAATLTRDHIVPSSRGGQDCWENVVSACRRCNQFKGSRLLEETHMELLALPYRPNPAEYLALVNSRRILADQMEFLRSQFSKNARSPRLSV